MTDEKKEKKVRQSRNPESIVTGALKLPLQQRVDLCKKLKASIAAEVGDLETQAKLAKETVNGL